MILIDANILLHAYNSSSERHKAARAWLETVLTKPEPVGLTWRPSWRFCASAQTLALSCLRCSPRKRSRSLRSGWSSPQSWILAAGERHWPILSNLLVAAQAQGPLVMDAHLAALAIEHGVTLATTDRDFARFPGLRTLNPLEPRPSP